MGICLTFDKADIKVSHLRLFHCGVFDPKATYGTPLSDFGWSEIEKYAYEIGCIDIFYEKAKLFRKGLKERPPFSETIFDQKIIATLKNQQGGRIWGVLHQIFTGRKLEQITTKFI